ncbi:UDP-N-acetylmuramate dehydrogenase [Patescibacteria group bacterium]|nr:UDP-N-acetylmuramate dehydrogenase [Patescibacteria group bacterium]
MLEESLSKNGIQVLKNEPMKNHTTFKIGGPAKFFVAVNNKQDLFKCLTAVREENIPYFILGWGSNVLVSDKGLDGLVIKLIDGDLEFSGNSVSAFAGHILGNLVRSALKKNLGGLEFAANIPGTIGGAVRGNAGAYGRSVGDFVHEVEVLEVSPSAINLKKLSREDCDFSYRESIFKKNNNWVVSEVILKLEPAGGESQALAEIQKEAESRNARQPLKFPSAGSTFKNVIYTADLEKYKDWAVKGKIPAAKFIEEAGLKGMKIGGAMVSDVHANFIVNSDNASADDIVQLISLVKTKVRDEFNVQLQEEIQYLGF